MLVREYQARFSRQSGKATKKFRVKTPLPIRCLDVTFIKKNNPEFKKLEQKNKNRKEYVEYSNYRNKF